jgi:hypothetical protein
MSDAALTMKPQTWTGSSSEPERCAEGFGKTDGGCSASSDHDGNDRKGT